MKKIFFIIFSIPVFVNSICAQGKLAESSIPRKVKSKFKALYPDAKVEYWTKEDSNYLAEFDHQKKEMVLFITPDGKELKTEIRIPVSGLPKNAKDYIAAHYPGKKITDAVTTSNPQGDRIFEADVDGFDMIFDVTGKFIKAVKERPVE